MGCKIVCKVRSNDQEKAVEFTWSEGSASFKPYALRGELVDDLRENAKLARERLRDLVILHEPPPAERSADDIALACAEVATVGHDLYNQIFDPAIEDSTEVGQWLREITEAGDVATLEIVNDGQPWFVPWNIVYDDEPDLDLFKNGGEGLGAFEPFWGMRYNLCGGLPVDPLRRMPLPRAPRVLFVVNPVVLNDLCAYPDATALNQCQRLKDFIAAPGWSVAHSRADLAKEFKAGRPHVIYWLGHAEPDALYLGEERIDLSDLRRLLRNLPRLQGNPGGLVFLNACKTAQSSDLGSFLKAFHEANYSGIIATEEQVLDNFANPFGIQALDAFLNKVQPIGVVLHGMRRGNTPLGLLYGTYCPPDLQVRPEAGLSPKAAQLSRGELASLQAKGTMLGGHRAVVEVLLPALPESPYRPLEPFGAEHRTVRRAR